MSRKAVAEVRLECVTVDEAHAIAALLAALINNNPDAAALGVSLTFKEPRSGRKGGALTYGMLSTGIDVSDAPDDMVPPISAPTVSEGRIFPLRDQGRQGKRGR